MPHQCTNCGETFDDGSKEMLSGCPECGGHKFQFRPSNAEAGSGSGDAADRSAGRADASSASSDDGNPADADGDRADRQRADRGRESPADDAAAPDRRVADVDAADRERDDRDHEDRAQADARSGVVSADELSEATADAAVGGADGEADPDRPDLSELREELNSQFESIRILGPGQYELNLMELYDRDEYIISLREDGRYVIEVPETWRGGGE